MTPSRRADDAAKFKVTLRDLVVALLTCAGMVAAQVGVQMGMRSDIRDLGTKFANFQTQSEKDIATAQKTANLAIVNDAQTSLALAELKGFLEGLGVKGIPKSGAVK